MGGFSVGADAFEKSGAYIPKELVESIERTRLALKGPVGTLSGTASAASKR